MEAFLISTGIVALAEIGDKELKTLIEKDLEERAQRGRPQNDA